MKTVWNSHKEDLLCDTSSMIWFISSLLFCNLTLLAWANESQELLLESIKSDICWITPQSTWYRIHCIISSYSERMCTYYTMSIVDSFNEKFRKIYSTFCSTKVKKTNWRERKQHLNIILLNEISEWYKSYLGFMRW